MTVRVYSSPPAFKAALEQRLKATSKDGVDFARRRQLLVFDRFLARVSAALGNSVLLKGGLVLELRLERARTTKDVDLPIETHIAEKLHAYTMPRTRMNTRVKDLPDIALLAGIQSLQAVRVRKALDQTFTHRSTHPLPHALPEPPTSWSASYQQMARENELAWATLDQLTTVVATFLNPILAGGSGVWNPAGWRWD